MNQQSQISGVKLLEGIDRERIKLIPFRENLCKIRFDVLDEWGGKVNEREEEFNPQQIDETIIVLETEIKALRDLKEKMVPKDIEDLADLGS